MKGQEKKTEETFNRIIELCDNINKKLKEILEIIVGKEEKKEKGKGGRKWDRGGAIMYIYL